jgi:hypothetical protein
LLLLSPLSVFRLIAPGVVLLVLRAEQGPVLAEASTDAEADSNKCLIVDIGVGTSSLPAKLEDEVICTPAACGVVDNVWDVVFSFIRNSVAVLSQ